MSYKNNSNLLELSTVKLPKPIGIMATDPNGVIGSSEIHSNCGLLWHYPDDIKHFQNLVKQQILVMGRQTFMMMPQSILDNCHSIVFSHSKDFSNLSKSKKAKKIKIVNSLSEYTTLRLSDIATDQDNITIQKKKVFMVGGAKIANLFLKHRLIDEFILTKINHSYVGDIKIDLNYFEGWNEVIVEKNADYKIVHLHSKS